MRAVNPYTPGAGSMPPFLAGRETVLEEATFCLNNVKKGYPQQHIIYFGLRGVGKTVLLNTIEQVADSLGMYSVEIESDEESGFTKRLIASMVQIVKQFSTKAAAKEMAQRALSLIRSFRITYSITDQSFSLGADGKDIESTGIYSDDLTDILVMVGKAAEKAEASVVLFVDEMQYLSKEELSGLSSALHRCNQKRLPILFFGAGLPVIRKAVGEAKSYGERLYRFEEISALDHESAAAAIVEPAKDLDVSYRADAVEEIISITGRYPFFIQAFCQIIWNETESDTITKEDVLHKKEMFFLFLDDGFFSVRYDKCSRMEKSFLTAMVKCGQLPCTISNVAQIMGRTVKSISPFRGKLINKGLIYSTSHAEIDFTVPAFDGFIRRINPELTLQM